MAVNVLRHNYVVRLLLLNDCAHANTVQKDEIMTLNLTNGEITRTSRILLLHITLVQELW